MTSLVLPTSNEEEYLEDLQLTNILKAQSGWGGSLGECETVPSPALVVKGECTFDRDACSWRNTSTVGMRANVVFALLFILLLLYERDCVTRFATFF